MSYMKSSPCLPLIVSNGSIPSDGISAVGVYVFLRCPVSKCHCPHQSDGRDLRSVTCVIIFHLTDFLLYLNTPGKEVPLEPTSSKVLWLGCIPAERQDPERNGEGTL